MILRRLAVAATAIVALATAVSGQRADRDAAIAVLKQSADAIGGEARLRALRAVEVSGISVWNAREQSERPEGPWIPTFTEFTDVRNFSASAVRRTARTRGYVEEDTTGWSADASTLVFDIGAARRTKDGIVQAAAPPDLATVPLELGPERVAITAMDATDVRLEADAVLHGYNHRVVAFTDEGARVRLFINPPSMVPKAVEITRPRPYDTYWAPWGDVTQRLTFGVWLSEPGGFLYPRLWAYTTGSDPDGTVDLTRVRFDPEIDVSEFAVPDTARQSLAAARRRVADMPLGNPRRPVAELAPGIVSVPGSWDVVEVKQDGRIVILEAPVASAYSAKVVDDAQQRFAGARVSAVVTTSDAWPHIGGAREYVARGIPIYALDRNVPILTRLFAARYATDPDALAKSPRNPLLKTVSAKTIVGKDANRFEIYPLRTPAGERQMMVYFPEHKLLYTSDLFTIQGDNVFLPAMVAECVAAVRREGLDVARAFGMHYGVLPWATVRSKAKR